MTEELNEVPRTTPDFTTEAATKLAELFPEVATDGKINLDTLKTILDIDVEDSRERFGLTWPGKREAIRAAQTPTTATLMPDKENSVEWDTTQNVFIEGDNLEVLKTLQKHYYGKIKMIYIDPPYNTGNDFVYADDYADSIGNYLELTGQTDEGGKLSTNSESAGRFHSNWLNMMYPRLKLARDLLTQNGAIFISVDDNELTRLTSVMDEVFGEGNRLATITTIVKTEGRRYGSFAKTHEYIVVYARNADLVELNELEIPGKSFKYHDARGGFNLRELRNQNVKAFNSKNRPNLRYPFYCNPDDANDDGLMPVSTSSTLPVRVDAIEVNGLASVWRWGIEKSNDENFDLVARKGSDGIIRVYQKVRKLKEAPKTVWFDKEFISNKGTKQVDELFQAKLFDFPKPLTLIEQIIKIGCENDSLIIDFFAGSGTTAHATMQLNANDGGNRACISIQLPEPTVTGSVAQQMGYKTLTDVSRDRIRLSGQRILADEAAKLDGRAEALDVGFRAYKLVDTNFSKWTADSGLSQEELAGLFATMSDSANDDARPEALLTEVLLKLGFSLSEKIETVEVAGLSVFSVSDGLVMAYLDEHMQPTLDQLHALVAEEPERLVVLEDAFQGNDELKTNLVQECRTRNVDLWTA